MTSEPARSVGLLAIGDELVQGAHPDLNSPWLASRLTETGRTVARGIGVGDDEEAIAEALLDLSARATLVVASGGLGPTLDDVTRHAAARAAGVPLVRSEEAWEQVLAWYARADRGMPASNERQALVPLGAVVLDNPTGTAPGFRVAVGGATLFVLPGPPAELTVMAERHLLPWAAAHPIGGQVFASRRFHLFDLSESVFADLAGSWMSRAENPLMGVTVSGGILSVKLVARAATGHEAEAVLAARALAFGERFGQHVFSEHSADLGLAVGEDLVARGMTATTAESCTGGLVAGALTRAPGISAVFREGIVAYSDEAKVALLGVEPELLARHGAVSQEVALAMASGAAARAGARLAVSVTGIAGPTGGTPEKPVGLVCFGLSRDGETVAVARRWPDAGRDRIRGWRLAAPD